METPPEIAKTHEYSELIAQLKGKIQAAQWQAAVTVNSQLIELYWDIGKLIIERQQQSQWGDNIIAQVAADLTRELGGQKGYSRTNLYRMKRFCDFYGGPATIVPQSVGQIPWGHNILLFEKLTDPTIALWYGQKTLEHGWARSILQLQIESDRYGREVSAAKVENFSIRLPKPQSDLARETLKDPFSFAFLGLDDDVHERAIEQGLVDQVSKFLLELGKGFAFLGKQYHLEVGGDDFYIDLLLYHTKLHAYVALELKNGPFKPEYAGKLNFYLTALDEQLKMPQDNPSIGMVLCKDKNNIVAEYALRDINKPMGVARFETRTVIPEELKSSLPTIEEVEAELQKNTTTAHDDEA